MTWQEIAKAKKDSVFNSIPIEWRLSTIPSIEEVTNVYDFLEKSLSKEEVLITNSTVLQLADKIAKGELTSLEVTEAFCHRAALAHQLTTCCSEIFFDRAISRAKTLDEYFAKHKKPLGPLHGIPISLKDQVNLEGLDSAIGYVSLLNKPKLADEVSNLAKILEDAGCVFYIKTTTPMAMMAACTESNIYGHTLNSINRKLSSGGSSGGEGSVIGARGSPLGFGTDIGGSIRIPSSFQGLYGLRASSNRIPYCKVTNSFADAPILCSVIGPMAWSIEDLELVTKLIVESQPWLHDPKSPPIPWRDPGLPKGTKLAFGIIKGNGFSKVHPPVERALKLAKDSLLAQGHEIIEWEPPVLYQQIRELAYSIFGTDGYQEITDECARSGEPIVKALLRLGGNAKKFPKGVEKVQETWEQARVKYLYQQQFDEYWLLTIKSTSTGRLVDGVLSPCWESCSFKPEDLDKFHLSYTTLVNILDLTAITVPITNADKTVDKKDTTYVPISEEDKIIYEYYDPELYHGAPAGIQIITPRYTEERAIHLAKILRDSL